MVDGHKFDPANRNVLVAPERAEYLPPKQILDAFGVKEGWHVADVGCGPGYFTLPMARRVGSSGRVYAVDMEPAMLEDLRRRVARAGLENVVPVPSQEDRIPVPDATVDFAFLACVLHELAGVGTLREIRRMLKPDGVLGVVDWRKIEQDMGPPVHHRLTPEEAAKVLREGGFEPGRPFEVAPYHYGFRCGKG